MTSVDHRKAARFVRVSAAAGLLVAPLIAGGCAAHRAPAAGSPVTVAERLASILEGSYSSAAQAGRDPDYRDIRLTMARIWKSRADGPWLYVEQAVAGQESAPYRQRVYHLVPEPDGTVRSVIFALPDAKAAVGAWKQADPLAALAPESLALRNGCDVILRENSDGSFEGGTQGTNCASDLRGATYATSTAHVTSTGMVSWDRGFDAAGKQVWGAEKGGYEFVRRPSTETGR